MNPADTAPLIHPTALIHPGARLGAGVRVGPYAVIEGPAEIGERCVIQAHAVVTGWVRMGAENTVGYGAIVGGDPQDYSFNPATESWVILGDHNRIREYSTLHRGTGEGTQTHRHVVLEAHDEGTVDDIHMADAGAPAIAGEARDPDPEGPAGGGVVPCRRLGARRRSE